MIDAIIEKESFSIRKLEINGINEAQIIDITEQNIKIKVFLLLI